MAKRKTLSVIIPVYNEEKTIKESITKVKKAPMPKGIGKQLIIVDDCSTDSTRKILNALKKKDKSLTLVLKDKNGGKGSAVRAGFEKIKGDYVIIQDADLEYDPSDYKEMLVPILKNKADVVYGSRFLGIHRSFLFWNYVANKFLTLLTNILYNTLLTDMETCYKLFRSDVIKSIRLRSNGFEIEPEITSKILKKKYRIYEVPISFYGRSYDEGKKISALDGIIAVFTLFWYRIFN